MTARHAFLVGMRPRPTFRVRSQSEASARLVVLQRDGRLLCNCPAAGFHSECSHVRIAERSVRRRTGIRPGAGLPDRGEFIRDLLAGVQ